MAELKKIDFAAVVRERRNIVAAEECFAGLSDDYEIDVPKSLRRVFTTEECEDYRNAAFDRHWEDLKGSVRRLDVLLDGGDLQLVDCDSATRITLEQIWEELQTYNGAPKPIRSKKERAFWEFHVKIGGGCRLAAAATMLERREDKPPQLSGELTAKQQTPIGPEDRTSPMTYRRAAKLMGKGDSQDAAEWLSKSVADGSIPCEHISRQTHVFSKRWFPETVWPQIMPK